MSDFVLKFAEHVVSPETLPVASVQVLLSRGFAHVLGNEVSSKIVARIRKEIRGKSKAEVTSEQVRAFRGSNEALVDTWTLEAEKAVLQALADGTLGVRASTAERPARVDPLTREIHKIAAAEITKTLKDNKLAVPKGETKVVFPNGDSFTLDELVVRRLANHGGRITKEAEKILANLKKATADLSDL